MSDSKGNRMLTSSKLHALLEKVFHDSSFRKNLENDPLLALANEGIEIQDPQIIAYLRDRFQIGDKALLADGQAKKIFAVASIVSIGVAASTPAFPKGDDGDIIEKTKGDQT